MGARKVVHQLLHTLSYGDAISGEVLAIQRALQEAGVESSIYAINVHPKLEGQAEHYSTLPEDFDGTLLFHFSLGSPINELYSRLTSAHRVLLYHNLTPAHWFEGVNPRIRNDIEQGACELPELCRMSDRLIADSPYNAGELKELGFHAEVLPLPIDPGKWDVDANPGIAALLASDPALHVMHVGRLAPNKCIEDIIKTFYFIHHKIDRNSKLWLAGIDIDTELYSFSLKRMVEEFDLTDAVRFTGCLADSELKALYQHASCYLCMSEHEGFCLPVIEAMNFGCPVIAYAGTALPHTVGNGGILVEEKRHPEIAELVVEIHRNETLKAALKAAGHKRVEELSYEHFRPRVLSLLLNADEAPIQAVQG